MRKKILYIGQLFPYPPNGGGRIKNLNTLKSLAKFYHVFAVFISEENPSSFQVNQLEKLGINVKVFYKPQVLDSVENNLHKLFHNYFKKIPHSAYKYYYSDVNEFINYIFDVFKPDILHIAHVGNALYLKNLKNKDRSTLCILEIENVEFELQFRRFFYTKNLKRKFYLLLEAFISFFFEKKHLILFDHIFTISDHDKNTISKFFGLKNISTQKLFYKPAKKNDIPSSGLNVGFVGNLCWPPNEDAVEWFLDNVYDKLCKEFPKIKIHILGKYNDKVFARFSHLQNVVFYGYKENITDILRTFNVFVLPFRMGSGVRIKALTALANSLPIVSTKIGMMGLDTVAGRDYLLANNDKEFVRQIGKILNNKNIEIKLRKNSTIYIKRHHGETVNNSFLKLYVNLTNGHYEYEQNK